MKYLSQVDVFLKRQLMSFFEELGYVGGCHHSRYGINKATRAIYIYVFTGGDQLKRC